MATAIPQTEPLYEDAPCGLLLTTADGTLIRTNQTFCRWSGFAADELVGKRTLQSLLTVGGRIFHQTHWAPLLQMQGSVSEVKLDLVHADGSHVPFVMNAQRRAWQGEVLHEVAVFIAKDRHQYEIELVKARKRSDQALQEAQRSSEALREAEAVLQDALEELQVQARATEDRARFAEQMMGIVGHDLRNPLNVIKLQAQLWAAAPSMTDEKRQEMSLRMRRSVQVGERLIADMLDFTAARLGSGISVVLKPIDLHSVVAHAIADLRIAYPGRRILHAASGEASALADADRVVQLLGNLVTNAVVHGAATTLVEVRTSADVGMSVLEVGNQGNPIPADLLPKIFEPMTRGHAASTDRSVGLGLFIVSEIARAHGGSVSVASAAPDGTLFTVRLPLARAAVEP